MLNANQATTHRESMANYMAHTEAEIAEIRLGYIEKAHGMIEEAIRKIAHEAPWIPQENDVLFAIACGRDLVDDLFSKLSASDKETDYLAGCRETREFEDDNRTHGGRF